MTASVKLLQVDSQNPYELVHRFAPVQEVPALTRETTFVPAPATPLLDAIGRGINDVERNLADIMENYRPSRVSLRGDHRRAGECQPRVPPRPDPR